MIPDCAPGLQGASCIVVPNLHRVCVDCIACLLRLMTIASWVCVVLMAALLPPSRLLLSPPCLPFSGGAGR